MSGVFGHRFARRKSTTGGRVISVKYCASSHAVLRHAKYVYDWLNPSLARRYMTFGRVKASDSRITSGCFFLTSLISHSQNPNGLVCGLSTRRILTPCATQNSTTDRSSVHSSRQASVSKSKGTMSSYFLGGFSANWIVPSGRWRNHSGCSLTYG